MKRQYRLTSPCLGEGRLREIARQGFDCKETSGDGGGRKGRDGWLVGPTLVSFSSAVRKSDEVSLFPHPKIVHL